MTTFMTTIALQRNIFLILVITLTLSGLWGCSKKTNVPTIIEFELTWPSPPYECQGYMIDLDKEIETHLVDFRLYLHDIELQDNRNQWHSIKLIPSQWQNDSTVLLDFENAKETCELGTQYTNRHIIGTGLEKPAAIRFTLGVPFELNHKNPLIAERPLNESSMHWHWQSGYKFLRAEFRQKNSINYLHNNPELPQRTLNKRFHLGSLQCKGEVSNITHCEQPNRVTYTIENFDISKKIFIDTSLLITTTDETNTHLKNNNPPNDTGNTHTQITCMGKGEQPWCVKVLTALGLGPEVKPSPDNLKNDQTNTVTLFSQTDPSEL